MLLENGMLGSTRKNTFQLIEALILTMVRAGFDEQIFSV